MKFDNRTVAMICLTVFLVLALPVTCTVYTTRLRTTAIQGMVEKGTDPMRARCSLRLDNTYDLSVCTSLAVQEPAKTTP